MDRVPLVVDRDHDREGQRLGNPEEAQLAAERFAQGFEQPLPAFGVVGEFGASWNSAWSRSSVPSTGETSNERPSPRDPPGLRPLTTGSVGSAAIGLRSRSEPSGCFGSPTNADPSG